MRCIKLIKYIFTNTDERISKTYKDYILRDTAAMASVKNILLYCSC